MEKTTVKPPLRATSRKWPPLPADSPYIDSYQNLSTMPMAIRVHPPNCQNNLSATANYFQQLMKKSRMVMLCSLNKIVILHPYLPKTTTSPQWPLSSIPKVAVVERFNCMQFFQGIWSPFQVKLSTSIKFVAKAQSKLKMYLPFVHLP